jgi:hypothetical protein
MLDQLAKAHPAFARWNEKAYRREDANRPFCTMPPQADELAAQFACHPKQRILDRDRGYVLSAWNGRDDACGASFLVFAGDGNKSRSRHFSNSLSIDLHRRSVENADLTNAAGSVRCCSRSWRAGNRTAPR